MGKRYSGTPFARPQTGLIRPAMVGAAGNLTVRRVPETVMRGSVATVTCLLGILTFAKLLFVITINQNFLPPRNDE